MGPIARAGGLVLACVIAACGGESLPMTPIDELPTTTGGGDQQASPVVRLYDNIPEPSQLIIPAGTRVEWRNFGANNHTVTNYSQGYDEWDDALVEPGESFVHVFQDPGDYGFICIIHQEVGYVSVTPADVDFEDGRPDLLP